MNSVKCRRLELGLAVRWNNSAAFAQLLLQLRSDSDALHATHRGLSLLAETVASGQPELVQLLLQHSPSLIAATVGQGCQVEWQHSEPALLTAARRHSAAMVRTLLQHGATADCQDTTGHSPLWAAVWARRCHVTHVLVCEAGARVACAGRWHACPVHLTAREPAPVRVLLAVQLVRMGAVCRCRDRSGHGALHWAQLNASNSGPRRRAARQLVHAIETVAAGVRWEQPAALRHLCRLTIRQLMATQRQSWLLPAVRQLQLPDRLARFLLFEDQLEVLPYWSYDWLKGHTSSVHSQSDQRQNGHTRQTLSAKMQTSPPPRTETRAKYKGNGSKFAQYDLTISEDKNRRMAEKYGR